MDCLESPGLGESVSSFCVVLMLQTGQLQNVLVFRGKCLMGKITDLKNDEFSLVRGKYGG